MPLSLVPLSALFPSIKTSNFIRTHKRRAINEKPFSCSTRHCKQLHTAQRKPKALFRLWVDNCFSFFVSGVIVSSSFLLANPIAYSLNKENLKLNYPCEDVRSYYSGVDGLRGAALMKDLGSLVSDHKSLPYKEVWEALKILDAADVDNPEASSEVIEIYSLRAVSKLLAGKPEGWNREHLWPRSYGLTDGPSLTDLHNLRPADVNVNSSRGNKYYGECVGISTHCLRPASQEAAPDTETDRQSWAPPFQVRGDIARSVMYMAVCYGFLQPDGNPYLQLSDSPSIERREMGLLSALLQWNELDPPSRAEQLRNDRICRFYQHNRNPFVDHPEYANFIWKHAVPSSPAAYSSSLEAWINEFHYNNKGKDQNEDNVWPVLLNQQKSIYQIAATESSEHGALPFPTAVTDNRRSCRFCYFFFASLFVEIIARSSKDASTLKLVLYNGANGRTYRSLALSDEQAFTISDAGSGFLIYTAFIPLQNGPADGIALVSGKDGKFEVLQFLSYEGTVKATDGPTKGMESVDIVAKDTDESSDHDSVGLGGRGIGKFEWRKFTGKASPGKLNIGQKIY